jgi:Trpc4-associated protein
MINTINIHNLSQENVSCLNTTLVLLMLANRSNQLPKYLRSIKSKSIEMLVTGDLNTATFANPLLNNNGNNNNNNRTSSTQASSSNNNNMPLDLITNFRDLLIFWQSHYLQKDKDCIGLEQNSRIEFSYWKHTVELLLDTNPKNNCSLSYYLRNDLSCLNATSKASRLDEYRCD